MLEESSVDVICELMEYGGCIIINYCGVVNKLLLAGTSRSMYFRGLHNSIVPTFEI